MEAAETSSAAGRRTGQSRPGGRSERVVREVLAATATELARAGYAALRIEDVAERAGVNKTTIYRRWPTKAALVAATLRSINDADELVPDTGSLRADLLALLRAIVLRAASPERQGITRVIMAELSHPEVEAIARALREERQTQWIDVIARAAKRGELPPRTDHRLMAEVIVGTVHGRLFRLPAPVDEAFLAAVVDLVLAGAKNGGARRRR